MSGTLTLLRFALRRDRFRIVVWLIALIGSTLAVATAFPGLYPSAADREVVARTMDTPAGLAFTGPAEYLTEYSYGSMLAHEMIGFMGVLVGLMSIHFVVRHTRTEEETDRAELVRAGVVGRHASLGAALIETALINVALALGLTLSLGALSIESFSWEGAAVYGAADAGMGLVFAGVAAITAQIFQTSRAASGSALAVVGLTYMLRASGDATDTAASWASPIGWAQHTFPYVHNNYTPLLLCLGSAVLLSALGFWLSTRRDLGAGLRAPRGGRPTATAALHSPLGFALRLHRGSIIAYAIALAAVGAMYGPFFGDVEQMLQDIGILHDAMAGIGGDSLIDGFIAMIMTVIATVAAVFTVATVLRARAEENAGRAEVALANWQTRTSWLGSHLIVAVLGAPVMLLLGGLTLGATGAATIDDPDLFGKVMGAAAAYIPALWLLAGVTALLIGWLPSLSKAVWLLVAYGGFLGYFGDILQLDEWTTWFSPFGHTPKLPVEDLEWAPLVLVTVAAVILSVVGLFGFRRRDLHSK